LIIATRMVMPRASEMTPPKAPAAVSMKPLTMFRRLPRIMMDA
jgi:hypothetical protein